MTEIILRKGAISGDLVKYDLLARDLPDNFLGLAADLKFQKPFGAADFAEVFSGEMFRSLSAPQQPFIMARALPDQGKLVFGMTLKSGDLPRLNDGVLASFTFQNPKLALAGVENQVLSIYDQGRKDWGQTTWIIADMTDRVQPQSVNQDLDKATAPSASSILPMDSAKLIAGGGEQQMASATNLNDQALMEILHTPLAGVGPVFPVWYWLVPVGILLLLVALTGLAFFIKNILLAAKPDLRVNVEAGEA